MMTVYLLCSELGRFSITPAGFDVEVKWPGVSLVGAVTDISERKRAEVDLQNALDEIKKLRDQLYKENVALREEVDKASMFEDIVGESPVLQTVLERVAKVAPTDSLSY
jgi:transcriptional regulator with GAF, ATPase, and Fis domain